MRDVFVSTSTVARMVSCEGNRRMDVLKGNSKALERWIHVRIRKTNDFMLGVIDYNVRRFQEAGDPASIPEKEAPG